MGLVRRQEYFMCDGDCPVCAIRRRCRAERILFESEQPLVAYPARVFYVAPDGKTKSTQDLEFLASIKGNDFLERVYA